MSRKNDFIKFVNENTDFSKASPEVQEYWNIFSAVEEKDKPLFTENGEKILKYMQEHITDLPMAKSMTIAEGLLISSRGVAGAMRKLVTDEFVEKVGSNPCIYTLTEKGKNYKFD